MWEFTYRWDMNAKWKIYCTATIFSKHALATFLEICKSNGKHNSIEYYYVRWYCTYDRYHEQRNQLDIWLTIDIVEYTRIQNTFKVIYFVYREMGMNFLKCYVEFYIVS